MGILLSSTFIFFTQLLSLSSKERRKNSLEQYSLRNFSSHVIPFNWKQLTLTSPDVGWYSAWKPIFTAPNHLASTISPFIPAYPTSDQSCTPHSYSEKYLTFEMPRGIPWDDLTLFREKKINVEPIIQADAEPEPRDFNKDAYKIGKRALFGLVVRN